MKKKKILIYPNKTLNMKSKKVKKITTLLKYFFKNMFDVMYRENGIGLAAIQIGINLRIIVIDVNVSKNKSLVLINPSITNYNGLQIGYEACLSFPGIYVKITRYKYIKVKYVNQFGFTCYKECKNIVSRCVQHEIDHLDGYTVFNHISEVKKKLIKKRICV